ncbi:MAG: hypothetical protein AVO39_08350 [delta proteobacterium MLS_D]|jgi:hypothetical protein|nr:MAG: hypothetical protein AVO39_08350 [delta proteobacterium MLS_D]
MAFNQIEDSAVYGTRKMLLVPLALDAMLALALFLIVFPAAGVSAEAAALGIIALALVVLLAELFVRKVELGMEGITISKFLRTKTLAWNDITRVDALAVRKKVYILLSTNGGFHVVSNNLADFTKIVSYIVSKTGDEKIDPAVRNILANPLRRISDVVLLWLAAFIMVGILCYKLVY